MPPAAMQLGSLHIRYKFVLAEDWRQVNRERANDNRIGGTEDIGANDVVISIDNHVNFPSPNPSVMKPDNTRVHNERSGLNNNKIPDDYKISVFIPPLLLQVIVNDALVFLDTNPSINTSSMNGSEVHRNVKRQAQNQAHTDSLKADHPSTGQKAKNVLFSADNAYNKTKDRLTQAKFGLDQLNKVRSSKGMSPIVLSELTKNRVLLNRMLNTAKTIQADIDVADIMMAGKLSNRFKGIGTVGTGLAATMMITKWSDDSWTSSTVVDGAIALAGIGAALFLSAELVAAVAAFTVIYQLVDMGVGLVTDKSLSEWIDEVLPRNKPFANANYVFFSKKQLYGF